MKPFAAAGLLALAVIVAAPAAAQLAPLPGITVQGRGAVRRPADAVHFSMLVADRQTPAGGIDALVEALRKSGVADAAIANPLNNLVNAQAFVTVTGSIRKPTIPSVSAAVLALQSALPPNAVTIQNLTYTLTLDDCTNPEAIADRAAFRDALAHAQRVAAAAHVVLGPPTAIGQQNQPGGPCPTKPDRVFLQYNQNLEPLAWNALDVTILVNENVTFAIR